MSPATPSAAVPYSARQQDLFYPAKDLSGFPTVLPKTDAQLCAWMCLLAYRDNYPASFAFDQGTISAKLSGLGFQSVQFFESVGHERQGGTHCLLAIHDDPDPNKKRAVVAFRGTDKDDPTDLLDDVDAPLVDWQGASKVYDGFKDALEEVQAGLLAAIQPINYKLLMTGHSLGAAIATLLASLKTPTALYTIGSPRVGDAAFTASLGGVTSYRYVDCCDAVTELPPAGLGYAHLGNMLYIDRHRKVMNAPSDGTVSADHLIARAEYLVRYAWKTGNVGVRDLADHAPINYVTAIAAQ
jgi:Lipase (class 3)